MALIDVVKWDHIDGIIAYKFPSEALKIGTQLIVRQGQRAVFVKDGEVADWFEPGNYTLKTSNLPLLNKLINLPFGGDSPFQAEVWFVSTATVRQIPWGIGGEALEDPNVRLICTYQANGTIDVKLDQFDIFLKDTLTTKTSYSSNELSQSIKRELTENMTNLIQKSLDKNRHQLARLGSYKRELSDAIRLDFNDYLASFGFVSTELSFGTLRANQSDPNYQKIIDRYDRAVNQDSYDFDRRMDAVDTAAANEGAGSIIGAGLGAGLGFGMGNVIGGAMTGGQQQPGNAAPPPLPAFHIAINGQQMGPFQKPQLQQYVANGQLTKDTLVWKPGLSNWVAASTLPELQDLFGATPPPLPPTPPVPPQS